MGQEKEARFCKGTRRDGTQCRAVMVREEQQYCFWHDPHDGKLRTRVAASVGAPPLIGEDDIELFCSLVARGETIGYACESVGVSLRTYWRARKRMPEFREAVEEALTSRVSLVADALYQGALSGNPTQQIFFLCNRDPENWKHVQTIHAKVGNEPGETFKIEHGPAAHEAERLTDDEWVERIAELAAAARDREGLVRSSADVGGAPSDGPSGDAGALDAEGAD